MDNEPKELRVLEHLRSCKNCVHFLSHISVRECELIGDIDLRKCYRHFISKYGEEYITCEKWKYKHDIDEAHAAITQGK